MAWVVLIVLVAMAVWFVIELELLGHLGYFCTLCHLGCSCQLRQELFTVHTMHLYKSYSTVSLWRLLFASSRSPIPVARVTNGKGGWADFIFFLGLIT